MKQNGEPTVEEILASIKQVIARDGREPSFEPRRREAAAPGAHRAADAEDDVLDLANTVRIDDDALAGADAPLLDESVRAGMRESLAALAALSGPGVAPQIVRSGETSLEGMVRDLLRPPLAEWLDTHLPALVEKMVAAEIARIVGKKG